MLLLLRHDEFSLPDFFASFCVPASVITFWFSAHSLCSILAACNNYFMTLWMHLKFVYLAEKIHKIQMHMKMNLKQTR